MAVAVTITFDDLDIPAARIALCQKWGLTPVNNANAKQALILYVKSVIGEYNANVAIAADTQSAIAAANALVIT